MKGREQDADALDRVVATAREQDRIARSVPEPRDEEATQRAKDARKRLREATAEKKKKMGSRKKPGIWERQWWDDLANRANEANRTGDQAELYRIYKQLGLREINGKRDGGSITVADVDSERELWKDHFQRISEGRGEVAQRVWTNVSEIRTEAKWLGEPPSWIEMENA